jgi:hypothetical protein
MGPHFLPPLALVRSMSQWGIPEERLDLIHHYFFRTLWAACTAAEYRLPNSQHAIEKFVKKAVLPHAQWYFSTGKHLDDNLNDSLRNGGWICLSGRYDQWQSDRRRKEEDQNPPPAEWPVLIEPFETEGFRFVPLTSPKALQIEGERMQNCIAKYAPRCLSGEILAFSVRDRGCDTRLATMTLRRSDEGHWVFDDINGENNFGIPPMIADSVEKFLGACGIAMDENQGTEIRLNL